MAHIGELNAEQAAALDVAGRVAIARLAEEIASSMRKYQRFDRVQIVVRANGQPAVVPWNVAQRTGEWPHLVLRYELSEAIQVRSGKRDDLHPDWSAWRGLDEKIAAEQRRIDELRMQA
ncbi:MAG: hypothetical protein ACREHD_19540, partial [Pirellulales bacterium]